MKLSKVFIILIALQLLISRSSWGQSILSVSTENITHLKPQNRLDSLLLILSQFDKAWNGGKPHQAQMILESGLAPCESWLLDLSKKVSDVNTAREGYLCLILESERINQLSPWKVINASERLAKYFETLENSQIPQVERLYAEGRIYSSLPSLYGRDLKKALIALETVRRLEQNPKASVPWIIRIRKIQGKDFEKEEDGLESSYTKRKETDGLPVGLTTVLYGSFPQGIGLQVRGQDHALFDTLRKLQGRIFATHRGSLGGELKLEDFQTLEPVKFLLQLQYLHGIQEYHGIGLFSSKASTDLYIDKGIADLAFQKNIFSDLYLKLGLRFHSSHLRKIEGGVLDSNLEGISNAFDMGLVSEIGFDSRDSETDPYRGQRVFLQSYLPRKSIGSSRSFDRFLAVAESFWLLTLQTQLKLQGVFCTVSDTAPFGLFSQLSGTVPFAGVRTTRFLDRSLLAFGSELRWKKLQPVTLFAYSNAAVMNSKAQKLLSQKAKFGAGLGGEVHLTRFRGRAFRIEAGNFGGEWSFNSMIGISLE